MSNLEKLSNSFHAAGTNGRLVLSIPWRASCCPTHCPCSTWSGSWIARFAKESVAPNQWSLAGWMPARTDKSSVGEGRKHPVTMRKVSLRILSMRQVSKNESRDALLLRLNHEFDGIWTSCGLRPRFRCGYGDFGFYHLSYIMTKMVRSQGGHIKWLQLYFQGQCFQQCHFLYSRRRLI